MNFWIRILMIKIVIITIKIQLQEGFNSTGYFCLPKVEMNNYAIFSKKYQGKFLIRIFARFFYSKCSKTIFNPIYDTKIPWRVLTFIKLNSCRIDYVDESNWIYIYRLEMNVAMVLENIFWFWLTAVKKRKLLQIIRQDYNETY